MGALSPRGKGAPLSFYIAKYLAYALALIAAVWVASFALLSASIDAGAVYSANYGAANAARTAEAIRAEGAFDPGSVPTAYRYALLDASGGLLATDMDEGALERALAVWADAEPTSEVEVVGSSGVTYAVFDIPDGTSCVLASAYMPQFASPALRDALPNPQNLMLAAGAVGSLVAVALVARRAGRAIARKMAPLMEAAARVSRQELDFSVEAGTVREVNEVLAAMDGMRESLKESLEARWDAERRQRDQVAALAHDLKTPLTVVRANAEYIAEEAAALASGGTPLGADALLEVSDAASDVAGGAERLDAYVQLLIEASQGSLGPGGEGRARVDGLVSLVRADASRLASVMGTALEFSVDDAALAIEVAGDGAALARAVMNVVSNALEHASGRVDVKVRPKEGFLEIEVADDGEGFSPGALEHGCERFFRGDPARSGGHYGLGLYTASETVLACGGTVGLSNRDGEGAGVRGARVLLRIPAAASGPSEGEARCRR